MTASDPIRKLDPDAGGAENPHLKTGLFGVGIGASAGGIEALSEFFSNVPSNPGMAFVVILHLSPDHDSKLAEVLQAVCPLPVEQVTKRTPMEKDRVYVIPPDKSLSIDHREI